MHVHVLMRANKLNTAVHNMPFFGLVHLIYIYMYVCNMQVLRGHQRQDELLSDYCDGTLYKSHPLFSSGTLSLEILAYYDDVEVCNPLGSRAKKHKSYMSHLRQLISKKNDCLGSCLVCCLALFLLSFFLLLFSVSLDVYIIQSNMAMWYMYMYVYFLHCCCVYMY